MKISFAVLMGVLSSCLFASQAQSEETIVDKSTGLNFPKEVSFEVDGKQFQLDATGVATRKKLIIKVYSIASYLQKGMKDAGGDKFERILSPDSTKQLTMKYVRDVSVNQIQDAFQDSFKRVFPHQEYVQMQGEIASFLHSFNQGIRKGDEYVLRWLPGGNIEVLINGKKTGGVQNEAFARGLWNIWFGRGAIVDRSELVSLMR